MEIISLKYINSLNIIIIAYLFYIYVLYIGSATAGFIARTICHPIDTAKSRLQSNNFLVQTNTIGVIKDLYLKEGWRGLYRGYGAVALGGVPGICIYLTTYEVSLVSAPNHPYIYLLSGAEYLSVDSEGCNASIQLPIVPFFRLFHKRDCG